MAAMKPRALGWVEWVQANAVCTACGALPGEPCRGPGFGHHQARYTEGLRIRDAQGPSATTRG